MDEMCRRMLVISADDMSPDVVPHGARETVSRRALGHPGGPPGLHPPPPRLQLGAVGTRAPTDTLHKARLPAETAPHSTPLGGVPRQATADV